MCYDVLLYLFRGDVDEWVYTLEMLLLRSKAAAQWFMEYLSSDEGNTYIK